MNVDHNKISQRINQAITKRLQEFETLGRLGKTAFDFRPFLDITLKATPVTELLFCISTANSSAKAGIMFQKSLESTNPFELGREELEAMMRNAGVRFSPRKAEYAEKALKNYSLVERAMKMPSKRARETLLRIKGFGYKEASHFLRNTGRRDVAIIDRHVMRWMCSKGLADPMKSLTPRKYVELESVLGEEAEKRGISLAEFDLRIWCEVTGMVLK